MQSALRRTILITGANKGIGYVTVERFLSESTPYDIILTSRDVKLGEKAVENLKNKYPTSTSNLIYHQLDVNDDKSVENLVASIQKSNRKIDVLINNAGILFNNATEEQKHLTVKTNYFSVVNLTEKLIPYLSDDGKILQVSSLLGQLGIQGETLRNALSEPNLTESKLNEIANNVTKLMDDYKPVGPFAEPSYPASKALLNAYVRHFLPSKVKSTQQIYAIHPGWIQTELGGPEAPGKLEEGADTIAYLTGLPFVVNSEINARMIGDRKLMEF